MTDWKTKKVEWRSIIAKSEIGRISALAEHLGTSPASLRSSLSNNSAPSADLIIKLADALKTTPNILLGYDDEKFGGVLSEVESAIRRFTLERLSSASMGISGHDLMRWWKQTGGETGTEPNFIEHVDIYSRPDLDSGDVNPHRMGALSLASQNLGASSPDLLRRTIAPLGQEFKSKIVLAHKSSIDKGPVTTLDQLDVARADGQGRIQIDYIVTRMPIKLAGVDRIITHAELLAEGPANTAPGLDRERREADRGCAGRTLRSV